MPDTRRRRLTAALALAAAPALLTPASGLAAALLPTPRQSRGPFYPDVLPDDDDADLVKVRGRDGLAESTIAHISGRVLDRDGEALPGARVEIWQCDARGRYIHSRDAARGRGDPNFQGYGRIDSGSDGAWRFRTIRPVPYPGRAPHIHLAVRARGYRELVSQIYVAGDPLNERDFLFNAVRDPAGRARLLVDLRPAEGLEPGALAGRFDIVLGG